MNKNKGDTASTDIIVNIDQEPMVEILKRISKLSGYTFDFTCEKGSVLDICIKSGEPKTIYITSMKYDKKYKADKTVRIYKDGKLVKK